jgi:glycosyltransferase involved in cell wall biosynthesis
VLSGCEAVLTTSDWTRDWLLGSYPLDPARLHVARPGADAAAVAAGTSSGHELLCVAAVTPTKGHDVLVEALATLDGLDWRCVCVGDLDRDPGYVAKVRDLALERGIADRVQLVGPRTVDELAVSYSHSDVLVHATHVESYGMVLTEALAHGLPVIASRAGGLPEAMGELSGGRRPGLLVPPDDPHALGAALRGWLTDAALRDRLRNDAQERRSSLTDWATTTREVAHVLTEVSSA